MTVRITKVIIAIICLLPMRLFSQVEQKNQSKISLEQRDHLEVSLIYEESGSAFMTVHYRSSFFTNLSVVICNEKKKVVSLYRNLSSEGQLKIPTQGLEHGTYQVILIGNSRRIKKVKVRF